MTTSPAPLPTADRPSYFSGQLLTAGDLSQSQDVDEGMRRLHHRMLHGWGIASGLRVSGVRGDVAVTVGAGYALDSTGRELIVAEPVSRSIPPVAGSADGSPRRYLLVVRWTPDDDAVVQMRAGACATQGAVRRSNAPQLEWLDPAELVPGYDIVLAEVLVQNCRLVGPPEGGLRRLLNPPPTPYTATGRSESGWTPWSAVSPSGVGPWAVAAMIDTSEAGFGDTPAYLARIVGERMLQPADSPTGALAVLDGTPYVEASEPDRFRIVVPLLPARIVSGSGSIPVNDPFVTTSGSLTELITRVLRWSVEWIGVQS